MAYNHIQELQDVFLDYVKGQMTPENEENVCVHLFATVLLIVWKVYNEVKCISSSLNLFSVRLSNSFVPKSEK